MSVHIFYVFAWTNFVAKLDIIVLVKKENKNLFIFHINKMTKYQAGIVAYTSKCVY